MNALVSLVAAKLHPSPSHGVRDVCLPRSGPNATVVYAVATVGGRKAKQRFRMVVLKRKGTDGDVVSSHLYRKGFWEIRDVRGMAALAGERASQISFPTASPTRAAPPFFVDVGANLRYYSLLFAHAGFNVIAFEPLDHNRAAIEASLCLNPQLAGRVTIVPVAVVGEANANLSCIVSTESVYRGGAGNGKMSCYPHARCRTRRRSRCQEVRTATIDATLARLKPPSVDVVKIDIEGAECGAVKGGQSLFHSYRPSLVQWEAKFLDKSDCVRRAVESAGYISGDRMGKDGNVVAWPRPTNAIAPTV